MGEVVYLEVPLTNQTVLACPLCDSTDFTLLANGLVACSDCQGILRGHRHQQDFGPTIL